MAGDNNHRKKDPNRIDTRYFSREITDEVDERVRNGENVRSKRSPELVKKADEITQLDKTESSFKPSTSQSREKIFVTVHLKAKNAKRVIAKIAMLADVCEERKIEVTDNMDLHHDDKPHWRAEVEIVCEPHNFEKKQNADSAVSGSSRPGNGEQVKPVLVPIDAEEVKRDKISNSAHTTKLLQDGSVFKGEMRDGKPHGFGSLTYADTDPKQRVRFAGEFEDSLRRGLGCIVWRDGAQYAGDWFADKPCGFGLEIYPDGSSYCGQYEDDMRHGYGTYTFPSGAKVEGCWMMGRRHGKALEHSKKGIFVSDFEHNSRKSQNEFLPGQDPAMDLLVAKVRAAVDKGRKFGEDSFQAFERYFQVKLRRPTV